MLNLDQFMNIRFPSTPRALDPRDRPSEWSLAEHGSAAFAPDPPAASGNAQAGEQTG